MIPTAQTAPTGKLFRARAFPLRWVGGLVVSLGIIVATLVTATPAHAADSSIVCGSGATNRTEGVELSVGDTWTIENTGNADCVFIQVTAGDASTIRWVSNNVADTPASNPTGLRPAATMTVTAAAVGTSTLRFAGGSGTYLFMFTIDAATESTGTPLPVMQQFGKPATESCDAAPDALNWGDAGSGGWGESWAQWMNNGKGGAVCTRTLVYSDSLGTWTVG